MKENEKMSLAQCKVILHSDGSLYTDEQVAAIYNFLTRLAQWDYLLFLKTQTRELEFKREKQLQKENALKQAGEQDPIQQAA